MIPVLVIYSLGCKKSTIDLQNNIQQQNVDFFKTTQALTTEQRVVFEMLKKKNETNHFVDFLPENSGNPIWHKMIFIKQNSSKQKTTDGNDEEVMLPLSQNNSNLSSILHIIKLPNDSLQLNIYSNDYFYQQTHQQNIDLPKAKALLGLFASMDYSTFGAKSFKNIPTSIFPEYSFSNNISTCSFFIDTVKFINSNGKTGKTSLVDNCTETTVTIYVCATPDYCGENCDAGNCPGSVENHTFCSVIMSLTSLTNCHPDFGGSSSGSGTGIGFGFTGNGGNQGGGITPGGGGSNSSGSNGSQNNSWYRPPPIDLPSIAAGLSEILVLNENQYDWLLTNSEFTEVIYDELKNNNYSEEYKTVAKIIIDEGLNGLLNNNWDNDFQNTALPHLQNLYPCCIQLLMIPTLNWSKATIVNYAMVRKDHPEWSKARCLFEALQETVHITLDIAGTIPIVGEICDLTNGFIYTIQGDGLNASLSFLATMPVAGWGATAARWAKKTIIVSDGSKRTLKWIKLSNNIINFGDRGLLRKVLSLSTSDPRIAHHIIPWEKGLHPAVQKAAQSSNAFHLNELLNGVPLSTAVHSGNHASYLARVQTRLDAIPTNLSADNTRIALEIIINDIKTAIQNNPNTHIDNLIF